MTLLAMKCDTISSPCAVITTLQFAAILRGCHNVAFGRTSFFAPPLIFRGDTPCTSRQQNYQMVQRGSAAAWYASNYCKQNGVAVTACTGIWRFPRDVYDAEPLLKAVFLSSYSDEKTYVGGRYSTNTPIEDNDGQLSEKKTFIMTNEW